MTYFCVKVLQYFHNTARRTKNTSGFFFFFTVIILLHDVNDQNA